MPPRPREQIHLPSDQNWDVTDVTRARTRRGPFNGEDPFLAQLVASGRLATVDVKTLRSQPRRGIPPTLDFEMDADPEAVYITMARWTTQKTACCFVNFGVIFSHKWRHAWLRCNRPLLVFRGRQPSICQERTTEPDSVRLQSKAFFGSRRIGNYGMTIPEFCLAAYPVAVSTH